MLDAFPAFAWASGEECSTPLVPFAGRTVRVDELVSTGHLERLDADLTGAASLGIDVWRYGMPWHRTEVAPGEYDWTLWDRALAACERHGLTPVVDLCHFGLPDHYPGFCDPAWVEGFGRYVDAFLSRYSEPRFFTPVNEPTITATMSALLGLWNDTRTSYRDAMRALSHCLLADLEAAARIRADRDGWNVMAEGWLAPIVVDDAGVEPAAARSAYMQVAWDLRLGHPLDVAGEALARDIEDSVRVRIDALATRDRVIAGQDFYPVSAEVFGTLDAPPTIAQRIDAYEASARTWYARHGVDFWVSETSNLGLAVTDGPAWLESLHGALQRLRADGLPVRGLCWYSRGDQHDWDTALSRPVQAVTEVGLFDLDRRERPVAAVFRHLAGRTP